MVEARFTLDYSQVLALAKQLPMEERQKLSQEVLEEPDKNSWAYLFSLVEPNQDITEEEILEECRAVRKELYR